ncbi:MAG: P1 family peptidase, partial [Bacillota bacterium]
MHPSSARPTPRQLGIRIGQLPPGPRNDLTDVPGVRVGHATVVADPPGRPPARTGVTAVLPHPGDLVAQPVPAGCFVLNAYGKAVGLPQVEELGRLETPILLTNTLDVWRCAEALADHVLARHPDLRTVNPVVLECNDGRLSGIRAHHVTPAAVAAALAEAAANPGPLAQGSVGAGTGMVAFQVKGGIGSASRQVPVPPEAVPWLRAALRAGPAGEPPAGELPGRLTVGALVLANFGRWEELTVAGVPVGRLLPRPPGPALPPDRSGSIIMLLATDAPLDPGTLRRLARRAPLGMARTGGVAHHGSGDFALAFAVRPPAAEPPPPALLDLLFLAAVEATEEAILSALFTAGPMAGDGGVAVPALPVEEVLALLP